MKEVYIVVYKSGSYDDFLSKNIAVYVERQKAEDFCSFKNEAIRLTNELEKQIPVNEALSEPDCPSEDEKFKAWVEETNVLFEAREKYNLEQMKILLEKSSISKEMKEEIIRLFLEGYSSYLDGNQFGIETFSITE